MQRVGACCMVVPDELPLRRIPADRHVRVEHEHGPLGGAEAVVAESIGTAAIAEVAEIRIGADRGDVVVIARSRAHPRLEPAETRLETVAEFVHRAARIGQVAGQQDVAVIAFEQPRQRSKGRRAAPASVAEDVDERRAVPGAGITGGAVGTSVCGGGWIGVGVGLAAIGTVSVRLLGRGRRTSAALSTIRSRSPTGGPSRTPAGGGGAS